MNVPPQALALHGLHEIRVDLIDPDPGQPRKHFEEKSLDELAESIREIGVQQPIRVRPVGVGRYGLIYGERRWRATLRAELATIPAIVCEATDDQVAVMQLHENAKREDVSILEEADGIRKLVDVHGYSVAQVVQALGERLNEHNVTQRLLVARSHESVRELLGEKAISFTAAILLAKAPESKVEAIAARARKLFESSRRSLGRGDVGYLVGEFVRLLAHAPFDVADQKLVPRGACSSCPQRTGGQASLFGDVANEDRCLDVSCWEEKVAALWVRAQKDAKKRKLPILAEAWTGADSGYFEADSTAYAVNTTKTWAQITTPHDITIGRGTDGRIVELVSPDVVARVRELLRKMRAEANAETPDDKPATELDAEALAQARQRERVARDEREVARLYSPRVVAILDRLDDESPDLAGVFRALTSNPPFAREHALRLGLVQPGDPDDHAAKLDEWREGASFRALLRLYVASALLDGWFGDDETLDGMLEPVAASDEAAE